MHESPPSEAERTAALLQVAQAFTALFCALFIWLLTCSRFIQIPLLDRLNVPPSTIPALLWLAAAWQCRRAAPLTPEWKRLSGGFLIAAALHVYLLPYLGWWHGVTPRAYQLLNLGLLMLSCSAGLLLAHRLIVEVAQCLGDRVLRIEARLSLIAVPVIVLILFGLFYWSARRMGGNLSLAEWFEFLRASPSYSRASLTLTLFMPILPLTALAWETSQRIHAWLPQRRCPDDEA